MKVVAEYLSGTIGMNRLAKKYHCQMATKNIVKRTYKDFLAGKRGHLCQAKKAKQELSTSSENKKHHRIQILMKKTLVASLKLRNYT